MSHSAFCSHHNTPRPADRSAQALAALSELLAAKAELRQLHLWNGMSGDDGAVNLCPLLEKAVKLEDFKFGYSRVSSRGGVAVATALGKTTSLARLDLTGNTMGPDTVRSFERPAHPREPGLCQTLPQARDLRLTSPLGRPFFRRESRWRSRSRSTPASACCCSMTRR